MGGNQSYQFDQKLFRSQWERKQSSSFDGRTIWISKSQPNREIQEYPVFADTEDQIDLQRELFSLRRDSAQLVSATHLKQTVKGGLCSSSAQGRLFLQKIPLKLEALQHIPFPDILHVYFNALTGYKRLNKAVGPFRPGSEQIGFNNQGEAKVWMNMDFSASAPTSREVSQVSMVRSLLQVIEDVTDLSTTPRDNPSIMNYIYRNSNDVTFDQALSAIKEIANIYNGGVIPKNLECLHKVGIENISKSIINPREESTHHSQRNNLVNGGVLQNQSVFNQQSPIAYQYMPQQPVQTTVLSNPPVYRGPQIVQNNIPVYQTQTVQSVQTAQSAQNVQPVQISQQPIQFVQQPTSIIQQPIQTVPVSQPVPILGSSSVRVQNVGFNPVNVQVQNQGQQRFLQSQVQTVRPSQPVFIRPQQQRVIQQVVRTPQGPVQVVSPQSQITGEAVVTTSLDQQQQGSRVSQQQNVYNQIPVVQQISNQVPVFQAPLAPAPFVPAPQNFTVVQQKLNFQNELPEQPRFSEINKQSQVQILNQLQKQTSRQSEIYQLSQQNRENFAQTYTYESNTYETNTYETQFVPRNRNFIDSNTMSIGIDKLNSQELQSYSSSPQKSQVQKSNNLASSKFNDVSLQDGKSSQALLAQLRGFTSSKKEIPSYNAYEFSSNLYTTSSKNYGNYDFTNNYTKTQTTEEQSEDIYATFNKYSKGNKGDDNIELKYSMTKNLYEQPVTNTVQYEQNGYNAESSPNEGQFSYNQDLQKFQQQGQYHVDFDPQILADIQRLKN